MKKLMIAAAIVCAAAFAQAATCSWASGTLKQAAGTTGGWGSAGIAGTSGVLVTMQAFLVDGDTYDTVMAMTQEGIYNWAKTASGEGITVLDPKQNLSSSGSKTGSIKIEADLTPNTDYKSIVVVSYDAPSYNKTMVMAKGVEFNAGGSGKANTNIFAGTGGMENWTAVAVPEPTSAMLLLLGVAGMALRRRRA